MSFGAESKARVLIVDDVPIDRIILSSILSANGIASDMAEGGEECLELCGRNHYDLILMDHRMPDIDGAEALVRLKEIFKETGEESVVICHTADEAKKNINLYKAAGFADVLIKPVDPQALYDMINKYLPGVDLNADYNADKKTESEISKVPEWIMSIPDLNVKRGVEHCETADGYTDVLAVFSSSILEKSNDIEKFADEENWRMYSLRVHSLKSMSKLIGAERLSKMAEKAELAVKNNDTAALKEETAVMLDYYRSFRTLLLPLESDDTVGKKHAGSESVGMSILLIGNTQVYMGSVAEKLGEAGFNVSRVKDDMYAVAECWEAYDVLMYFLEGMNEGAANMIKYLLYLCRDRRKRLCLIGDKNDINEAKKLEESSRLYAAYSRPVDMRRLIDDMSFISGAYEEYNRIKTILVVDDDRDFQRIMIRWLCSRYKVRSVSSGSETLAYLNSSRPDLILLDYAMPEMDGSRVLDEIRMNPMTSGIPVIFMTGNSDREVVMHIVKKKPDGYFLKNMKKEELLDALDKFFAETIFKSRSK